MFFSSIHIVPVIISAVVAFALGFMWYSPLLFGKTWMKEVGMTPESQDVNKPKNYLVMALPLITSLATAYILAALFNSLIITSLFQVIVLVVSMWIAFVLPVSLYAVIFNNKSWTLFSIDSGFYLLSIFISSLVIFFYQ
jgi:hypothetical protein